jgi:hypothetical protein
MWLGPGSRSGAHLKFLRNALWHGFGRRPWVSVRCGAVSRTGADLYTGLPQLLETLGGLFDDAHALLLMLV